MFTLIVFLYLLHCLFLCIHLRLQERFRALVGSFPPRTVGSRYRGVSYIWSETGLFVGLSRAVLGAPVPVDESGDEVPFTSVSKNFPFPPFEVMNGALSSDGGACYW